MNTPHATGVGRALLVVLALAAPAAARAQFTEVPAPAAYALRNVTLVSAAGVRTPGMTVIVRGQRIEAIGSNLQLPADAEVLAGDSLLLYPGIVDAWGTVKHTFPKDSVDRARVRSWDPPRSLQGFMPHREVVSVLEPSENELAELRKKGVVAVAVQPAEGLMPGRGALLLLRSKATSPAALAVRPTLGPVLSFRGGRGMYPSTGMAVPTFYRQTLIDAQRRAQLVSNAPRGSVPPAFDADYAVLQEIIGGGAPAFFQVDAAEQIRHVLRLSEEFRLRPVIMGGAEAWQVADELKRRDVPVIVSLDFPKPRRWKPDAKPDTAKADSAKQQETSPAAVREQRTLEAQYANAGRLAAAGVRIALASGGKADIREGARKAIEHGLGEAAALRAVTATPAALFGIERVAEPAAGQPATFIVTTGPLFDAKSKVAYTFVEGVLERGAAPGAKSDTAKGGAGAQASLTGEWDFEVRAGVGEAVNGEMKLTQDGEKLTGTVALGEFGTASITSGTISGDKVNLTLSINAGGQQLNLQLNGSYDGTSMTGTGTSPMGPFDWTARRNPGGAW